MPHTLLASLAKSVTIASLHHRCGSPRALLSPVVNMHETGGGTPFTILGATVAASGPLGLRGGHRARTWRPPAGCKHRGHHHDQEPHAEAACNGVDLITCCRERDLKH